MFELKRTPGFSIPYEANRKFDIDEKGLSVRFFKKIQDWILISEKNPKTDFVFLY